jgi:predicted phosphohydrolase
VSFVFAHISDPHLSPLPFPPPWSLLGKRFFGCLSWYSRKRTIHQNPILDALVDDLGRAAPDHVVITGDLTNISLPAEFARARRWLEKLGQPSRVSVIPGNHDTYVPMAWERSCGLWAEFMSGVDDDGETNATERQPARDSDFPFVRRRRPLAFIGLSSAVPMPLLGTPAAGRLGKPQLTRLRQYLRQLGDQELFRVVLIHHPPYPGVSPRKALQDAEDLCEILGEAGAELVLHGHLHEPGFVELPTSAGPIPMIGLPSASARSLKGSSAARYHLNRLSGAPGKWELEIEVREVEPSLDRFRTKDRLRLRSDDNGRLSMLPGSALHGPGRDDVRLPGAKPITAAIPV